MQIVYGISQKITVFYLTRAEISRKLKLIGISVRNMVEGKRRRIGKRVETYVRPFTVSFIIVGINGIGARQVAH